MSVSRKSRSLKKSSKTKKHFKNVKNYKSKTQKHIRKMRGGVDKTCTLSEDCFEKETANHIKECIQDACKTQTNNCPKIKDEIRALRQHVYSGLYNFNNEQLNERKIQREYEHETKIKTTYMPLYFTESKRTGIIQMNIGFGNQICSYVNSLVTGYYDKSAPNESSV